MPPAARDLARRRPVWLALSELYLDTELQDADLAAIAQTCARSPYTLDELEEILFLELMPVLGPNLFAVAGTWTGFDPESLVAAVAARRPPRWRALRIRLGRRLLRGQWAPLRLRIRQLRASNP